MFKDFYQILFRYIQLMNRHDLIVLTGIWHTYVFGEEGNETDATQHLPSTDHPIGSSALLRDLLRTSSRRG